MSGEAGKLTVIGQLKDALSQAEQDVEKLLAVAREASKLWEDETTEGVWDALEALPVHLAKRVKGEA